MSNNIEEVHREAYKEVLRLATEGFSDENCIQCLADKLPQPPKGWDEKLSHSIWKRMDSESHLTLPSRAEILAMIQKHSNPTGHANE